MSRRCMMRQVLKQKVKKKRDGVGSTAVSPETSRFRDLAARIDDAIAAIDAVRDIVAATR
jgi:hypothetical protein